MMKLFAVRDVKADAFGAPMSVSTTGLAVRSFADACARPDSNLNRYPEDYMLYEIGTYDPNSGALTSHQTPKLVCTASALIADAKRPVREVFLDARGEEVGENQAVNQEVAK